MVKRDNKQRFAGALVLIALLGTGVATARAEEAWVRDEVRLNFRTGPGNQYRILGSVKTGDQVTVIERTQKWTKVRVSAGKEGWVPAGFLQNERPAMLRLARIEAEAAREREEASTLREELAHVSARRDSLETEDAELRAQLDRLSDENRSLKAGARWPEWITGAALVSIGMLTGAVLQGRSTRRNRSRIRL